VGADPNSVTVTRKGHEKVLALDKVSGFSVYETEGMKVSVGDDLQLTKNDRRGRNGDVRQVKGFDGHEIVLDNGCRLDLERAQHVRQGHTVTSQVSQSKEREKMFCLAMTSALPQINAAQALVDVSRAQSEARIYTDSVESFEVKVQADTGHRQAALGFLESSVSEASTAELVKQTVDLAQAQSVQSDLQEHVIQTPKKVNVVKQSMPPHEWHPGMDHVERHERGIGMER
jgi:hypothetical protein